MMDSNQIITKVKKFGTREQVWHGLAEQTRGGLTKDDILKIGDLKYKSVKKSIETASRHSISANKPLRSGWYVTTTSKYTTMTKGSFTTMIRNRECSEYKYILIIDDGMKTLNEEHMVQQMALVNFAKHNIYDICQEYDERSEILGVRLNEEKTFHDKDNHIYAFTNGWQFCFIAVRFDDMLGKWESILSSPFGEQEYARIKQWLMNEIKEENGTFWQPSLACKLYFIMLDKEYGDL